MTSVMATVRAVLAERELHQLDHRRHGLAPGGGAASRGWWRPHGMTSAMASAAEALEPRRLTLLRFIEVKLTQRVWQAVDASGIQRRARPCKGAGERSAAAELLCRPIRWRD